MEILTSKQQYIKRADEVWKLWQKQNDLLDSADERLRNAKESFFRSSKKIKLLEYEAELQSRVVKSIREYEIVLRKLAMESEDQP